MNNGLIHMKHSFFTFTSKIVIYVSLFFLLLLGVNPTFGSTDKEPFNAGDMIMDHVLDAHDWHIMTIGDRHVSIPLPIILWNEGELDIFMSSKFHHGTASYKGYALSSEGETKGRIICVDEAGVYTGEKPLDFSITKTVTALFLSIIFICILIFYSKKVFIKNKGKAPGKFQSLVEIFILFVRDDIAKPSIGSKYLKFLPYLLTLFLFIFLNNVLGLVPFFPGGANVTGNIGVALVLAVFTFIIMTLNGNKHYWKDIFNTPGVPWWLKFPLPLMPIIEVLSMFTKPIVLTIRLFANVTAGHIIIVGFMAIIFIFGNLSPMIGYAVSPLSVVFTIFMSLLELLVAFIQAYVFTLLSAIYFGMAVAEEKH